MIDTNQNGVLEEAELKDFFKTMIMKHQPGRSFSDPLFSVNWHRMDKNKDEKISFDEFWAFMRDKAVY